MIVWMEKAIYQDLQEIVRPANAKYIAGGNPVW